MKKKEIKFRRALILGNFYNRKVEIVRSVKNNYETMVDTIVGLKNNFAITKENGLIDRSHIKTIYQL